MREYEFSLTYVLPYNDRIYDFVLILENTGHENFFVPFFPCFDKMGGFTKIASKFLCYTYL